NMNEKYYGSNPKLGENDDSYLLTRLRLGFTYIVNENFSLRASLQDSRVVGWGFDDSHWYNKEFNQQHNPQRDNTEIYELYLKYQQNNLSLTVGRQKITYGDYRVFGPGEWKNSGKWLWDAAKLSYKEGENFMDIFYGGNVLHDPSVFSPNHRHGYQGAGLYGHYAYTATGAIEPIFAYKHNDTPNEIYNELTSYYAGFRVYDTDIYSFFYDMTYIKAIGDYTKLDNETVDINANGFHIDGGYHFKSIKTKVGFGYSYASGDDPKTSERETFDAVFGASDKYYGRLNLFDWSNLEDYEIFAITTLLPNTNIKLEYHKFYANQPSNKWKSYTIASMHNDEYGEELDVMVSYDYNSDLNLLLGASYFKAGKYIQEATTKNEYITDEDAYGIIAQIQYKF
ncbi:MAG: alginate export family protein, partial [Campylobacterales bacterium]|nr:alginate export family protein [Campylobacterales bacterium]